MRVRKFSELTKDWPAERRERVSRRVKDELTAMAAYEQDLKRLRQSLDLTQEEVAERLEVAQSQVSETERSEDMLLSTLRRYIEALGGQLELVANVRGKRIPLAMP